jgi:hypothetical protein
MCGTSTIRNENANVECIKTSHSVGEVSILINGDSHKLNITIHENSDKKQIVINSIDDF